MRKTSKTCSARRCPGITPGLNMPLLGLGIHFGNTTKLAAAIGWQTPCRNRAGLMHTTYRYQNSASSMQGPSSPVSELQTLRLGLKTSAKTAGKCVPRLSVDAFGHRPADGGRPAPEQVFYVGVHALPHASPDQQVRNVAQPAVAHFTDRREAKIAVVPHQPLVPCICRFTALSATQDTVSLPGL